MPDLIGPHVGRELELMLSGEKKLAYFCDVVPESGEILEEIIPERAFAPHVAAGFIMRFSQDETCTKTGHIVKSVCFTLPGEEWRAAFTFWLGKERANGIYRGDSSDDVVFGRVLGYSLKEIHAFLDHQKKLRTHV